MASLATKLSEIVGAAFEAEGLSVSLGEVRVSDRPDLAQFQCNGAMAAAKIAKCAPRAVAEKVTARLESDSALAKVEIAGPGFINLTLTNEFINSYLADFGQSESFGVDLVGTGQVMVLDYGGPNIAKAMHVGHLRASIIGDALRRICGFAGYEALGDVHMGDWGTPMGQIISALEIEHGDDPDWQIYFDESYEGDFSPAGMRGELLSMEDLEVIYPKASAACKEDEARLELARKATVDLQDGRRGYRALWEEFVYVSIAGMKANFDALNVHFDMWKGEASVHSFIEPMVDSLKEKGLAIEDGGALVVPVAREDDNKEMPPMILHKRDGAVMYGTTDLATIVERMEVNAPSKIVYIVDQRQALHFEQVFRVARLSNIAPDEVELTHAGFGTMNGTDGKPFKTRAGGVMKLEDLIGMGVEKANARLDEVHLAEDMGAEERAEVAHKVAIAAIKFADLQNNRTADYVFDIDRMTAFEGKTGPYLLYQAVRIKSLLRKAADKGLMPSDALDIRDEDCALALLLAEFPDQFALALKNYTPHVLCDYAFRLAQAFSSFYGNCHILSEEDEALRGSRLRLCAMTAHQLEVVLGLLGIEIPERM